MILKVTTNDLRFACLTLIASNYKLIQSFKDDLNEKVHLFTPFTHKNRWVLNVAFFQHFKDVLNEKTLNGRILFPKTIETLNAIGDDVYQFKTILQPYVRVLRMI